MKILICGGAGYIGSHTLKLLNEQGHDCHVLDNLSTGHEWAVQGSSLHQVDLLDKPALSQVFKDTQYDLVMHFCAKSLVGESTVKPAEYYENNVVGTLNLLNAMVKHGVLNLVFSSTAAIFGNPVSDLISEDHPQQPVNTYGMTKLMIESILVDFQRAYGLNSVALRYFNAAGASSNGEIGEAHDPETHLIPNILKSLLADDSEESAEKNVENSGLKVFGDDYATSDGTCIRDYIHVDDLALAHSLSISYLLENTGAHAFNLGSKTGFSVLQVIKVCEEVSGQSIKFDIEGRRAGDPAILVADNEKAREGLGWEPEHSTLHEIIESAWNWHKN